MNHLQELFLHGDSPNDDRKLFSYPSSVKGLKGVGGKVIVLEEASRLDQAVFQEVVVPLLGVRDTALIGISTPLDANNFYSELVESKKPDGDPLFNVVTIRLLCDACEKAGKTECPHNTDIPPWKSSERQVFLPACIIYALGMYVCLRYY